MIPNANSQITINKNIVTVFDMVILTTKTNAKEITLRLNVGIESKDVST